jgi:hypothetical protein
LDLHVFVEAFTELRDPEYRDAFHAHAQCQQELVDALKKGDANEIQRAHEANGIALLKFLRVKLPDGRKVSLWDLAASMATKAYEGRCRGRGREPQHTDREAVINAARYGLTQAWGTMSEERDWGRRNEEFKKHALAHARNEINNCLRRNERAEKPKGGRKCFKPLGETVWSVGAGGHLEPHTWGDGMNGELLDAMGRAIESLPDHSDKPLRSVMQMTAKGVSDVKIAEHFAVDRRWVKDWREEGMKAVKKLMEDDARCMSADPNTMLTDTRPDPGKRTCLRCGQSFDSAGPHNRICDNCED